MPYDELVLPLIIRMTNLEKLILNIDVYRSQLIDGNHLEKELIHHLTKLKQFLFHIHSIVSLRHVVYMPSNEDIQYSFRNFKDHPVISYVDYFPERNRYHSHMYSYSLISTLTYYNDISNHFSGGLFKSVRQISLYDERPFEHCFFLRIAQSFPFLEELTLHNKKPQKNENQEWSTIEYSHLTKLDLVRVDESYVEQFLLNTKTTFLNDVEIYVAYESVRNITHQFTKRCNADKLCQNQVPTSVSRTRILPISRRVFSSCGNLIIITRRCLKKINKRIVEIYMKKHNCCIHEAFR